MAFVITAGGHRLPNLYRVANLCAARCAEKGESAMRQAVPKGLVFCSVLRLQAAAQGMNAVIPPKKNRINQRPYNEELYKLRHLLKNAFLHLKRWRGIATGYAKNSKSFLAAAQIRCLALWLKIS